MAKCRDCGGYTDWYVMSPKCTCTRNQKSGANIADAARVGLNILALADWITPLIEGGKLAKHAVETGGPANQWTFFIPHTAAIHRGWSQAHIVTMLKANGIKIISNMVTVDELAIVVDLKHAHWAEYLLSEEHIPMRDISRGAPR